MNSHNSLFTRISGLDMDLGSLIISISVPLLLSIFGTIISFQNYKLNKKKSDDTDTEKAKENEARMVRIETDVSYIRQSVDRTENRIGKLEERLDKVEQDVEVLKTKI